MMKFFCVVKVDESGVSLKALVSSRFVAEIMAHEMNRQFQCTAYTWAEPINVFFGVGTILKPRPLQMTAEELYGKKDGEA